MAKRARGATVSVVRALERAEVAQQHGGGGGSKARLLSKLEGTAPAASVPRSSCAAVITEQLRQNVVRQLASALAANRELLSSSALTADEAAAVLERECHDTASSKAAYQQHATSLLVRVRKARMVEELPALQSHKAAAGGGGSGAAPADGSAVAAEDWRAAPPATGTDAAAGAGDSTSVRGVGCTEPVTAERLAERVERAVQLCIAAAAGGQPDVQEAACLLQELAAVRVTAAVLQATGAGKKLAKLRGHADAEIARAAAAAVSSWKAMVVTAHQACV